MTDLIHEMKSSQVNPFDMQEKIIPWFDRKNILIVDFIQLVYFPFLI